MPGVDVPLSGYEHNKSKSRHHSVKESFFSFLRSTVGIHENCNSKHGLKISYPKVGINNIAPLEESCNPSFKITPNKTGMGRRTSRLN